MARTSRTLSDARKRTLRSAEEDIMQKSESLSPEELARVGVVWSGLLDLEDHIPPATVAAMLSCQELVLAVSTVDAQENWINAAAFAAMAAQSEEVTLTSSRPLEQVAKQKIIGFSAAENED